MVGRSSKYHLETLTPKEDCPHGRHSEPNGVDSPAATSFRSPEEGQGDADVEERGVWGHKAEFILSCVGLSVGLGNVWRFPFRAYKNGGAAFVIAYLVLQLLIGKPMYLMELVMSQFSGMGPTKVWEMNPSAKGIGVAMCVISLITAIYYNTIMTYTLFYFFSTMQSTLPWTKCTQEWIDKYNCIEDRSEVPRNCSLDAKYTVNDSCTCTGNPKVDLEIGITCTLRKSGMTAAQLYFEKDVLQRAPTIDPEDMGDPLWKLTLCLLLSWIIVVFCLIKGIRSSGKVVYFTATFPYVVLIILLIRGVTLDGAKEGVKELLIPTWDELLNIHVWVEAAGQMFFSLSVSFGGIIIFGSYNKFKNKVYYDALFISMMDLITSIIAGFVVFSTLGYLADKLDVPVDSVAEKSYGLAFVTYPEALSQLPISHFWCLIFFFMLFTLGLDSEFAFLETMLTSLQDEFPKLRKYKSYLAIILGICCFFLALPCTTPGGDYVVTIMDHFGADFSVLVVACLEVISVMWVYGSTRFLADLSLIMGTKIRSWPYWIFTWTVSSPLLIAILITYRFIDYKPPTYSNGETFPDIALTIGWVLFGVALCAIPIFFLVRLVQAVSRSTGSDDFFMDCGRFMFSPTSEWKPSEPSLQKMYLDRHRRKDPQAMEMDPYDGAKENPAFSPDS